MPKQIKHILFIAIVMGTITSFAQDAKKAKDTIATQKVTVVKPYTPTISDAFKVKDKPSLEDKTTGTKKEITYNIFSIPVASTFTPAKGKAAQITKAKAVKLYDNYASLGFGSYTSIFGEVYLNHALSRSERIGGYVSHHSSQGGIDGLLLDDNFSNSNLEVNFTKTLRDMVWKVDGGFDYKTFNWYGVSQPFYDAAAVEGLDVGHTFYNANLGGEINFEDALIKKGTLRFRHFGDDQSSSENRAIASIELDVPLSDQVISTNVTIDYIGGSFDQNYYTDDDIKYGNVNIAVAPSYQLKDDDLTVNLGVNLVYLNDIEFGDNEFFIYPKITASYRIVDEILIAYGGVEGGLIQNSYYDFATENPFVSPTLYVVPTDQTYNASVGLKGKLSSTMSYNLTGRYMAENSKALFLNNTVRNYSTQKNYEYGNSFGIVYDDVTTFSVAGELHVDVNRNLKFSAKAEYLNYSTDNETEAWNLPNIKGELFLDYQIDEHWFTGASLFYVGERKDQFSLEGAIIPTPPVTMTLDGYFDANAHVGYKVNDRFSVYAKVNNIASQNYERWLNYPVQGIQFLAGATYQFDF